MDLHILTKFVLKWIVLVILDKTIDFTWRSSRNLSNGKFIAADFCDSTTDLRDFTTDLGDFTSDLGDFTTDLNDFT